MEGQPSTTVSPLPFAQRACFVAGPAKSGTTLLVSLLDGHRDLLVLPEETAYFPTVLTKYGGRSRREQFDYLISQSLANVLFGGACKWSKRAYPEFDTAGLRRRFEAAAFDPANANRDLLVLLFESYAATVGRDHGSVVRWVEKTPANRDHLDTILRKFPHAKLLLTLRDPRALLAAQILLERTRKLRRFSVYLCIKHWRTAARLALQQRRDPTGVLGEDRMLVVGFRRTLRDPETSMRRVCAFLDIPYDEVTLRPTKIGLPWAGNSATEQGFTKVSTEPAERWRKFLTEDEIGWVEWHCRDLMEPLGYEPSLPKRRLRYWYKPVRGETPKEYFKSRLYSWHKWRRS